MTSGPGRFANPAMSSVVQAFFESGGIIPGTQNEMPAGQYSETQMRIMLGVTDTSFSVIQSDYNDGADDYAERVYIWQSTGFEVDDGVMFIVDANGALSIENFAIVPLNNGNQNLVEDNFDFQSDSLLSALGNGIFLADRIDPFNIGQRVDINITPVTTFATYTQTDYENDKDDLPFIPPFTNPVTLANAILELTSNGVRLVLNRHPCYLCPN